MYKLSIFLHRMGAQNVKVYIRVRYCRENTVVG